MKEDCLAEVYERRENDRQELKTNMNRLNRAMSICVSCLAGGFLITVILMVCFNRLIEQTMIGFVIFALIDMVALLIIGTKQTKLKYS